MRTRRVLAALAALVMIAGCATGPQQSPSGYRKIPAASSVASVPGGIWYRTATPGRRPNIFDEVVKVEVRQWRPTVGSQHRIENATAYVAVLARGKAPRLAPLNEVSRVELLDRNMARVVAGAQMILEGSAVQLLACPTSAQNPTYADCLYAARGSGNSLHDDSRYARLPDFEDEGAGSNIFWQHVGLRGGKPSGEYALGATQAAMAADYSLVAAEITQRKEQEKRKAHDAAKLKEEAERRAAADFLRSARPGTTVFCVSTSLLGAGGVISSVRYDCDAPGSGVALESLDLATLVRNRWRVTSENRTKREGYRGWGFEVSLQLAKDR